MRLIFIFPMLFVIFPLCGASSKKLFHEYSNLPAGATVLTLACLRGDIKRIQMLLKDGMQVTEVDLEYTKNIKNESVFNIVQKAFNKQKERSASLERMLRE